MNNSLKKIILSGIISAFFAINFSAVFAQNAPKKQIPLTPRVMSLMREMPLNFESEKPQIKLKVIRSGLFAHVNPVFEVPSPDGKMAAGTFEGWLYSRQAGSEQKTIIAEPLGEKKWDIYGALWSPSGKKLAVKTIDETGVPRIPIIDWTGEHEKVLMKDYSRVGEKIPVHQIFLVNVETGKTISIKNAQEFPYLHILDWSAEGDTFYFLRSDRLTKNLELLAANASDGETKIVFKETNRYGALWWQMLQGYDGRMHDENLVRVLDNGNFIWTSERSGFPQLYLYDRNGKLIKSLTEDKNVGFVNQTEAVDEKRGFVYAVMQGAGDDVYAQTLYRFSLADGTAQKLADGPSILVAFSEDLEKLRVNRTGFPDILEVVEMNADGSGRKIIWSPDLSFLKDYGYAPEIVKTVAADGKTRLRSLIVKPKDFDPKESYPVIEEIYGGPNSNVFENTIPNPNVLSLQQVANREFIVLLTDGRGTPNRGQEFGNFAAGRFGQVEIADHAAVLRRLAKDRKYMDINRVGIFGHSWGGYFTLRALLEEPELYKAGAMLAPGVDTSTMRVALEPYMGCLPADCPANYKAGDNLDKIEKLNAPLLIIHGTADDDGPFAESIKLVDAIQKNGKKYEFVLLPGVDHIVQRSPLTYPKTANFFEKNLLNAPDL